MSANDETYPKIKQHRLRLSIYVLFLIFGWSLVIGGSLWFSIFSTKRQASQYALIQARTVFEQDTAYRLWNYSLGGFYVPITDASLPNPYYYNDRNREVTTQEGIKLTKINPAHMTRLVYDNNEFSTEVKGRLVNENPIRPENKPDKWEAQALKTLRRSDYSSSKSDDFMAPEVSEIAVIGDKSYLRYMRSIIMEKSCLACHSVQGYKEGEIGGGVSISIPLTSVLLSAKAGIKRVLFTHAVLWLAGLIGIIISGRRLSDKMKERNLVEKQLRTLTEQLELRVESRTTAMEKRQQELQAFMDHTDAGVYLKNVFHEYVLVNNRYASLFKRESYYMLGKVDELIQAGDFAKRLKEGENKVMQTGIGTSFEWDFIINGEKISYSIFIFPIFNLEGRSDGLGGIVVDLSDRKKLENDLRHAKEEAETANRAKSAFLANISHEIRTPLNGVLGMADLLLRTQLSADQSSMASTIKTSGDNLLNLMNDILDFSKIEAGKMLFEAKDFQLRDSLFATVKGLSVVAYKKNLEIVVYISPKVPDNLVGDYSRISQILLNLISNAIKFTSQGEVTLAVNLIAENKDLVKMRFSVIDTGIGIAKEKQAMIFEAFEQADISTTRKYGGTGLGLAISQRLVSLMGGELFLKSDAGKGSTFWFDLILPYKLKEKDEQEQLATDLFKNLKVLNLDDNVTNRKVYTSLLETWNIEVLDCATIKESWGFLVKSQAENKPFDLIIFDIKKPKQLEIDFIKRLKGENNFKQIPFILLSSDTNPIWQQIAICFQDILTKPVRPKDLLKTIAQVLGLWPQFEKLGLTSTKEDAAKLESVVSLKILLTEDIEINQIVACRMLTDLGHSVTVVNNGQEALDCLKKESFDLIFMDIQMPIMDGVQATKEIRKMETQRENSSKIPIVAMTAHALKGSEEKYLALGMDAYLSKPITIKSIIEVLNDVVTRFKLQEKIFEKEDGFIQANDVNIKTNKQEHLETAQVNNKEIATEVLNLEIIDKIFLGNKDLIRKSINLYFRDVPKLQLEIKSAINNIDNELLFNSAHALKGITGYFSRGLVYMLILELEQLGSSKALENNFELSQEKLLALNQQLEFLFAEMNNYLYTLG